jgi:hypothetical protein
MRRGASTIGIVLALGSGFGAAAQDQPRPRVTVVVNAPTSSSGASTAASPNQPTLRKPLGLPARQAKAAAQTPDAQTLAALALVEANPTGRPSPLRGLDRQSPSASKAQCRAQCSQARYVCKAREAGDCDTVWGACVVRCSGVGYTRTPDLNPTAHAPIPR